MARSQLLSLREAADRLASLGVGQQLTSVGAPPIARRGPKGEALYSGKSLDAWAAALPRRGRVAIASGQESGEGRTEAASRKLTPAEAPQRPWFAEARREADELSGDELSGNANNTSAHNGEQQ